MDKTSDWVVFNQQLSQMFNLTFWAVTGSKQPNHWVCPYFSQRWIVFNPAFFRVYIYVPITNIIILAHHVMSTWQHPWEGDQLHVE